MRIRSFLPLALLPLLLLACFEPPISEKVHIRFLPGDAAVVGVTVRLASSKALQGEGKAEERVEEFRKDLLEERDPWTRRLQSLEPEMERVVWDREEGALVRVTRKAAFEKQQRIGRFFEDTLIQARLVQKDDESELILVPSSGGRATRAQREQLEARRDEWMSALSRYFASVGDLYDFLRDHPEEDRGCLQLIFDEGKLEKEGESASQEGKRLAEAAKKSIEEVLEVFAIPPEGAYSLEELSKLVHDPFPAALSVQVPGPILESKGFQQAGAGVVKVPELGLWEALVHLEGRWISPDPLRIKQASLASGKPPDLEAFLKKPRSRAGHPSPAEIERALAEHLSPSPEYLIRWSTRDLPEMDSSGDLEEIWRAPAESEK
jgi:hypothetical protein